MQQRFWYGAALVLALALGTTEANAQSITFGTLPALQMTTPTPGSTHVPGDMDGNGVSDLLWFNPTTSQFGYWLMDTNDSTGVVSRLSLKSFNITPGYFVGAIGDFNGDGLADVVFTSNNHDLYLWTNTGSGGFTSRQLDSYPAGWILVGAGDVDGDGQDDLLWLNPSQCEFGYWLMKNGAHTTTKIIPIVCGYYPLSIGYYTPSNRISVIWTSAANDLYIWDSTGGDFQHYTLNKFFGEGSTMVTIGGGYAGLNMSFVYMTSQGNAWGSYYSRYFNASVQQTGLGLGGVWPTETFALPWSSAGFLIEGRGVNRAGVIYQHGGQEIEICPPVGGAGYESSPAPKPNTCPSFTFPQGWYVIGAMANDIVPVASP